MTITPIFTLSLGLAAIGAQAESFYVGGSLGASRFDGTADTDRRESGGTIPSEISLDGLPFESTETAWAVYGGRQVKAWLAIELGFADLGNSGREFLVSSSGDSVIFRNAAALNIQEWYLGTRFSTPLSQRISADWLVGVTRAQFDAEGSLPLLIGLSPDVQIEEIPHASPDEETGLVWGFGFNWKLHERVVLGIDYRQHNTQVLDVDTLSLGATFRTR